MYIERGCSGRKGGVGGREKARRKGGGREMKRAKRERVARRIILC